MRPLLGFLLIVAIALVFFKKTSDDSIAAEKPAASTTPAMLENFDPRSLREPMPSRPQTRTEEEPPAQELIAFRRKARQVLKELPTPAQVRANPNNDPHGIPEELSIAAEKLGELLEQVLADDRLVLSAIEFYHACAKRQDTLLAIRALCTRNFIDLSLEAKQNFEPRLESLPQRVREVADNLPKIDF